MDSTEQAKALLEWYDRSRRILPWREDPTPYHVWLSEIMLQQTRVEAVRAYYLRFLEALPDIASLAAAPEERWLKLWEGLGYYSRVRNLHKAAVQIMDQYGGQMPSSEKELLGLPGIGPYTAAAIASIAFGQRTPAIDGNLLRIFARMTCYAGEIHALQTKKDARAYYENIISGDRPGEFNQALMDLGAGLCLPGSAADCAACPWQDCCRAHAEGRETDFPKTAKARERRIEKRTVLLIYHDGRVALDRRPARGLLAGLCEFPNRKGELTEDQALEYVRGLGFSPVQIRPLTDAKHIFTHLEWHMKGYEVKTDEWKQKPAGGIFLADRQQLEEKYTLASAFAAYRQQLRI